MSGGCYDYMYLYDAAELLARIHSVERMAQALRDLGYGSLADETAEIISHAEAINKIAEHLKEVWRSVEWYEDGDYGIDKVKAAADAVMNLREQLT